MIVSKYCTIFIKNRTIVSMYRTIVIESYDSIGRKSGNAKKCIFVPLIREQRGEGFRVCRIRIGLYVLDKGFQVFILKVKSLLQNRIGFS